MAGNDSRASIALREEKQTPGVVTLILALASGDSVKDAARLANVSERTVYRRLRNESFAQRVKQARTSMLQQAVGRLAKAVPKASDVLDKLLDSRSERIRLQAAKAVMDCSVKLGDAVAYEQRLASLEATLNMRLPKRERQKNRDDRRQW
jgi:soluble lytic murein transglycosylase-like protein